MPEESGTVGRLRIVCDLREAVLAPERREVEVVCIKPGLSKNGNLYTPEVVRSMAPLFEGARAFADHPAPDERPERSIRDIVGYYKEPRIDEAGALRAALHVTRNADWLWSLIEEAMGGADGASGAGQPDLIGVSIDADARVRRGAVEGRTVRVVESITRLNSCDVVTRASAGGRLERLLQADRGSWWDEYLPANEEAATLAAHAAGTGLPLAAQQTVVPAGAVPPVQLGPTVAVRVPGGEVQAGAMAVGAQPLTARESSKLEQMFLKERAGMEQTDEMTAAAVAVADTPRGDRSNRSDRGDGSAQGAAPLEQTLREVQEDLRYTRKLLKCERTLARELDACALPAPIKQRLERRFSGRIFEQEEFDGAITEERDLLAALTDAGLIRGMGFEKSMRVGMNEADRLQKAFDQLFEITEGERVPALSGIREAYIVATGDRDISGISQPGRLLEADVTTASFSFLLGTSMNKRLLKDYQAWPWV